MVSALVGESGFGHSDMDDGENTPLLIASQNGKFRVVEIL